MENGIKERKYYIAVALISLFYAGATYMLTAHLFVWNGSDVYAHTDAIVETWLGDGFIPFFQRLPYFGWHALAALFIVLGASPLVAASLTNALLNLITAIISSLIISELARSRTIPVALLVIAPLFVSAIWVPMFNPEVYLGQGSPNVWNNPTYIAIRPFALLTTWLFICAAERAFEDVGQCVLLAVLVVLGVIAKPTFFQALAPAAVVFFLSGKLSGAIWAKPNWRNVLIVFLPAIFLAVVEFAILFFIPSSVPDSNNGGGIALTFFDGWSKYTPNPVISILILLAFPLYSAYVNRGELLSPKSSLSILTLMLVVGLLEVLLVVETGAREGHGNFAWALYGSVFLYWVFSIGLYGEKWRNGSLTNFQKIFGVILIAAHLFSGLYYFMHLLFTTAPF